MKKSILILSILFIGIKLNAQIELIPSNAETAIIWDLSKIGNNAKTLVLDEFKKQIDSSSSYYPKKFLYQYLVAEQAAGLNYTGKIYKFKTRDSFSTRLVAYPISDRKAALKALNKISANFKVSNSYYESEEYKLLHKTKGTREYYFYYRNMEVSPTQCIVLDEKYLFLIEREKEYEYNNDYAKYDEYKLMADSIASVAYDAEMAVADETRDYRKLEVTKRKYLPNSSYDAATNFKLTYWNAHAPQPRYIVAGEHILFDKLEKDSVYCQDTFEVKYWEEERVPEAELYKLPDFNTANNKFNDSLQKAEIAAEKKRKEDELKRQKEKEKVADIQWTAYFDKALIAPKETLMKKTEFAEKVAQNNEYLFFVNNNKGMADAVSEMTNYRRLRSYNYDLKADSIYKNLPLYKLIGDQFIFIEAKKDAGKVQFTVNPGFAPKLMSKAFLPQNESTIKSVLSMIKPEDRYNLSFSRINLPNILSVYQQLGDSFYASLDKIYSFPGKDDYRQLGYYGSKTVLTVLDMMASILSNSDFARSLDGTVASATTGIQKFSYKYHSYEYNEEGERIDTMYDRVMEIPKELVIIPLKNKEEFMKNISALFRYRWLTKVSDNIYKIYSNIQIEDFPSGYGVYVKFNQNSVVISNDSNYIWNAPENQNQTLPEGLNLSSALTGSFDVEKTLGMFLHSFGAEGGTTQTRVKEFFGDTKTLNMNLIDGNKIVFDAKYQNTLPKMYYTGIVNMFLNLY